MKGGGGPRNAAPAMNKVVPSRPGLALEIVFVAVAYGVSWATWAPLVLAARRGSAASPYFHLVGGLGPAVGAVVAAALGGRGSSSVLVSRLDPRRSRPIWLAVAVLGPIAVHALASVVLGLAGHPWPKWETLGVSREYPDLGRVPYWAANIVFYGFGEEVGWRGYLLPRLQARHNALVSALIVAVVWAIWHVPLFWFAAGMRAMGPAEVAGWFFSLVTGSILLTWLFNSSRGCVTAVALFHGILDIVMTSPGPVALPNVMGAVLTLAGIAIVFVARPANLARQPRETG